ncbi:MAG: glycine zipper family protein [Oryzomonas sp.]|uniref:glycine zipper family protein n=1 Tax=Oryzomonas sp. TaxID=2855186 RepID=UPI0028450734|nr:glycine zipper family protein [Oryzomonas sp.]MDR3580239.1 glycine zipper family protein [Oryzomonas sp.]
MKKSPRNQNLILTALVSIMCGGCATAPFGPTVNVMPAPGKPFEMFQKEQKDCEAWAFQQMGGQDAVDRANTSALLHGVVGTLVGTAIGATIGAGAGNAGAGAGIGAGAGMAAGTADGAGSSAHSTRVLQRLYNDAFEQCMYAKGNQVPSAM